MHARELITARTAFIGKKKEKLQVLFPPLLEERSRRPAHSPVVVTHALCWHQLGAGPADSAARPKMNKNAAGASLPVSLSINISGLGKTEMASGFTWDFSAGLLSRLRSERLW